MYHARKLTFDKQTEEREGLHNPTARVHIHRAALSTQKKMNGISMPQIALISVSAVSSLNQTRQLEMSCKKKDTVV